jgi:hypothetical protein
MIDNNKIKILKKIISNLLNSIQKEIITIIIIFKIILAIKVLLIRKMFNSIEVTNIRVRPKSKDKKSNLTKNNSKIYIYIY